MSEKYILALDEGTTSARAVIWDRYANQIGFGFHEIKQIYPKAGWVEQKPNKILEAQLQSIKNAIKKGKISINKILGIGITNQRETTVIWNKNTGKPIYNAIVWQCKRTSDIVDKLNKNGYKNTFIDKTGLIPDSYFSATKIKWILDTIPKARETAKNGNLLFGTIDTFLLWKLSGGKIHKTDYTNASRTMLFNIHKLEWDYELLEILKIPDSILPEPCSSSKIYGYTDSKILGAEIPISGIIGDQQSALFGQTCFFKGELKNTYGTGCFLLLNTGKKAIKSKNRLLTTIAFSLEPKKAFYALEGSVFIGGGVVQWLHSLGLIKNISETSKIAKSVLHKDIFFVPAFVGLGAPYWDQYARGIIIGITQDTNKAHIIRAGLESVAFQTLDVVKAMENDYKFKIKHLNVDGGMAKNDFLMQFQSDILNIEVIRPKILETTALGAGFLAGIALKYWKNLDEIKKLREVECIFTPQNIDRKYLCRRWREAVKRAKGWVKEGNMI